MLASQLLADDILGRHLLVQSRQIQERNAELLRGNFSDGTPLCQFVLDNVGNEGCFVSQRLNLRLLCCPLIQYTSQHHLPSQPGQRNIFAHGDLAPIFAAL